MKEPKIFSKLTKYCERHKVDICDALFNQELVYYIYIDLLLKYTSAIKTKLKKNGDKLTITFFWNQFDEYNDIEDGVQETHLLRRPQDTIGNGEYLIWTLKKPTQKSIVCQSKLSIKKIEMITKELYEEAKQDIEVLIKDK